MIRRDEYGNMPGDCGDMVQQARGRADFLEDRGSVKDPALYRQLADEVERLQRIIDGRPAINAGLPETYIRWSQSIYAMEFAHIREQKQ